MSPETHRRHFLALSAAGVAAGALTGAASATTAHAASPAGAAAGADRPLDVGPLRLWYTSAASEWLRALPIGNGRLGAMVFGGVQSEQLQLNEDTVWGGAPYDPANSGGLANLPEIRRRVFSNDWGGAQSLIDSTFMGTPLGQMPYQTVGNLRLNFPSGGTATGYHRELDLTTAVALTRYTRDGVTHTREVFASGADQVIVVRLTASTTGRISFSAAFDSPQSSSRHSPDPLTIALDGSGESVSGLTGRVRFRALATVRATGGSVSSSNGTLNVSNADAVTLLVSIGTNYNSYADLNADQNSRALTPLSAAADRPYDELRSRHVADHQQYFGRTSLDLGTTSATSLPTDQRVSGFAADNDPQLITLLFQFGRYLLISSSRPGSQPTNLQGIWNDALRPPWSSKYTININTEMNYWPAGPTNLVEMLEPVLRLLDDLSVTGARTARLQYGAGGWVAHHNTDGWRGTAPVDGALWGMWQTGGAWMALHIWEHYRFTGDLEALRRRYPVLKGAAQFFVDTLVQDPGTGYMVTCPSNSPENPHHAGVSVCAGPTMDMQILRDLFQAVADASTLLGTDAEFRSRVVALRGRLAPIKVGAQGQIQEWQADWDAGAPEQTHRHVSHLYGLHPGNQITVRGTPSLAQAARTTLERRGDAGTGWSLAWKINFWARLEDGRRSYKLLRDQLTPDRTAPNLFCLHPPFQIDGNFGATAGIAEWLLQSHAGEVQLLPALPPELPDGQVTGLVARGGHTVDITWAHGVITQATLRPRHSGTVRIRTSLPVNVSAGGQAVSVQRVEPTLISFDAAAGTAYQMSPLPAPVVGLRSRANNQYVSAGTNGSSPLTANRTTIGAGERFDLIDLGGGAVALRAHANGQYVCAENAGADPLIANRTAIGIWETFQRVNNADGTVSLRAQANSQYVCAENAGADPLIANRTAIGIWESFDLITG
ncbi:glycosyl hydrolase family 95 catalytic domain-containing protein [Streptomyces litchfieldiae]|uniref:Glycoside hydrolase N-terminal domain-containing protein n=1 Tax=Streptomyces litchfieldiae TaxID=3075543 RepID=A0ABU2N1B4_9ACTN|nr:glycoside hydrolase N-terminal domain-containing protein [Streptomyces sp. DSM 44938]MDT0347691.1 glycoside hydrolase N-terminal domain-containing protein [Streptomyces sp. DSM 44938]